MSLWSEENHEGLMKIALKTKAKCFEGVSEFQKVEIVETEALGRALLLDGVWMTAEGDEKTYHEMISHPALTTAPRIKRVLIIGGGDGGTAREVLRHPEVECVDLVELDAMVVEACRKYLPSIGSAWGDPRLHVHIADGIRWVKNYQGAPYDVILVDGPDPIGPAEGLFARDFYESCAKALSPEGVFVTQSESPNMMRELHLKILAELKGCFKKVLPYYKGVVIYPGGEWSWTYASQSVDPMYINLERASRISKDTYIYNEMVHRGAFAVPNHIRKVLER